jgi:hypothetical protein
MCTAVQPIVSGTVQNTFTMGLGNIHALYVYRYWFGNSLLINSAQVGLKIAPGGYYLPTRRLEESDCGKYL